MSSSVILCLMMWCFVAAQCGASPVASYGYYPRPYLMGGSFYANPRYVRAGSQGFDYVSPGQMTAMVVGDTVATNSFSGPPTGVVFPNPQVDVRRKEGVEEQSATERHSLIPEPDSVNETEPQDEQESLFSIEDGTTESSAAVTTTTTPTTKAPTVKKIKVGKARRPAAARPAAPEPSPEEEEDDSPQSSWPFLGTGKGGVPAYNAFFPIFINGGSQSGRSRAPGENVPGSATAIANAFSTGKGGVATSHATAFGDPYAAAVLRNSGLFNGKAKSGRKIIAPVEELEA